MGTVQKLQAVLVVCKPDTLYISNDSSIFAQRIRENCPSDEVSEVKTGDSRRGNMDSWIIWRS